MYAIGKLLLTVMVGLVFGVVIQLLAVAVKLPPTNFSGLVCGSVGMFIALVIIGKASE
jgi:hypothetical protein